MPWLDAGKGRVLVKYVKSEGRRRRKDSLWEANQTWVQWKKVGCELFQNEYFCSVLFLSFCPFMVTVYATFLINFDWINSFIRWFEILGLHKNKCQWLSIERKPDDEYFCYYFIWFSPGNYYPHPLPSSNNQ